MTSRLRSWNPQLEFLVTWLFQFNSSETNSPSFHLSATSSIAVPPCFCQWSSSTLGLIHSCTSTHLPHPVVLLSWCFCMCPFLSYHIILERSLSPPVSPSYKMRSLDQIIPQVPLSSDAVWSVRAWRPCLIYVTSSKATILSHDLQEIFPDGIVNLFEIVFKIFSSPFLIALKAAHLWTLGSEDESRQHPDESSRR